MGGLRDISFGQIAAALGRYKPVVATVVAIVLLLSVLPHHRSTATSESASSVAAAKVSSLPRRAAVGAAAPAPGAAVADPATTVAPAVGTIGESSATPALASALTTAPSGGYADGTASAPTPYLSPPATTAAPPTIGSDALPLTVREGGWSTQEAGTPLSADGVPAGTLPVGTRVGRDDKRSFVRLSGDDTVLRLTEDPTGSRSTAGVAAVQACQITSAVWAAKNEMAMGSADEPTWDPNRCVAGTRASDGTWTFDLSGFPTRSDGRGFALIPAPGGPIDAQVSFKLR